MIPKKKNKAKEMMHSAFIETFKSLDKKEQDIILKFFVKSMTIGVVGNEIIKLLEK